MKRIFRTLCIVAMVALVTTSCRKKEEGAEFNVTFGETYGFREAPSLNGQKAYLDPKDGYKFKWNDGDQIMVYNLSSNYSESVSEVFTADPGSEGKQTARFTGTPVGSNLGLGYYLFYNADKVYGAPLAEGNKETFRVPDTQYGTKKYKNSFGRNEYVLDPTSLMMACPLGSADGNHINNFTLQHIFGYLAVAVGNISTGSRTVDNIEVYDAQWNLTGELDLKLPEVSAQTFNSLLSELEDPQVSEETYIAHLHDYLHNTLGYYAHGDNINLDKKITLECYNEELPYGYWDFFFITLRPGALYKGFTVKINFVENVDPIEVSFDEDHAMPYLIKPGWFRNLYIVTEGNPLQYN